MSLERISARRVLGAVAVLLLASLTAVAGGSAAPTPAELDGSGLVSTDWKPGLLRSGATTVVVELAGDPVSVQQGSAGHRFSPEERQAAKDALEAAQASVRPAIEALGGTITADYQEAYNGLKVTIDGRKLGALAELPNVIGVHGLQKMEPVLPENVRGVQLIGAPAAWASAGQYRGDGIKVAVIDTGIDYTHANFGGPGTVAAYAAADATDTVAANPLWFGPTALTKVKGGTDLVGDAYNASAPAGSPALVPHPDPNPLDCQGHGSHVAGTAVGFGVLADGSTYTGPYDATTYANTFRIGPGAAPKAELYSVRVFGCTGSTDVTVEAIEWAVENDMDVINMSLGSPFGDSDDPSAKAATNAAKAGVIVVTSAGNSGASQYITGSPGTGTGAIAVAANDANQSFPGVNLLLNTGVNVQGINANGSTAIPVGSTPLVVVREASGAISRGCEGVGPGGAPLAGSAAGEFAAAGVAGKIAVVVRADCARVAKAINGQKAGAVAVVMINNAAGLPPFEGQITSNPDTGEPYVVTIPFLGVSSSATASFTAAGVTSATVTEIALANANYTGFASFSSGGPSGDSSLKPDITAPGVSVISTAVGSGNGAVIMSGTSMAAPHVAGVAALVKQAHRKWTGAELKAAIVNTGNPAGVLVNRISRGGTGLVQPFAATQTSAVAIGDNMTGALSFGFEELKRDFSGRKPIEVRNNGTSPITFTLGTANAAGSPHAVSFDQASVTVDPGRRTNVKATLTVPVATAGNASAFREVAGYVTLTPGAGENNGVVLRVPYYLVPRALSTVRASSRQLKKDATSATVDLLNRGPNPGTADFYTWGLEDANEPATRSSSDIRAVGVQSFPNPIASDPNRRLLVFAINTYNRWSHPSANEFDVAVDVDNDGTVDYFVVGVDQGLLTGAFNGTYVTAVLSTRSAGASVLFLADAPTNGSTALLPFRTSQLCRAGEPCMSLTSNPRFTYEVAGFDLFTGGFDEVDGTAKFNAWNPSIESGQFESVAPGAEVAVPAAIDRAEYALTPALGLMAVVTDNEAGREEAQLISLKVR